MMKIFFLIILLLGVMAELELVVEVARHGARTPMTPEFEKKFGVTSGLDGAHLTPTGERQHYLLGLKRRKKYVTGGSEDGSKK